MRRIVPFQGGWLSLPLLCATVWAQAPVQEPDAAAKSAAVRAALLYKIASYLEVEKPKSGVPPAPAKQYRIGVLGDDATIATARKILPGKSIGDAKVEVVTVTVEDAAEGRATAKCDLLYIALPIDGETLGRIVTGQGKQPVPLVCAQPGFVVAGGTVQLFVKDGGTRFEMNAEALKRQGLRASAQLLKHSQKAPLR